MVIYYLEDVAPYAERLELFLAQTQLQLQLSSVALAEILAGPWRQGKEDLAGEIEKRIRAIPNLKVTPIGWAEANWGAKLRGTQNLKMPDALVVAAAITNGANMLLTNDRKLGKLSRLSLQIQLMEDLL